MLGTIDGLVLSTLLGSEDGSALGSDDGFNDG